MAALNPALPSPQTSFIGRERERAAIRRLLQHGRLVTLTGAGGCGKTRLALAVADEVAGDYHDGARLIELASLADPALLAQTVAAGLGLREAGDRQPSEQIIEELRPAHLLLVLDTCEHLVEACGRLAELLLRACPRLTIMATSREGLGLSDESVWEVPPLALPNEQLALTPEQLLSFESIRLFVERAQASSPAFRLTARNAEVVAQICRRLDGVPLALELVAARIRSLGVETIASRLNNGLALLSVTQPTALLHQRSLGATIDWSYERLTPLERAAFRRLAVFVGAWTPEAADTVLAIEAGLTPRERAPGVLESLRDKSLIYQTTDRAGGLRYRMLNVLREHALGRLTASGEALLARETHARYCLALAETAEPQLQGPDQRAWLDRLEDEQVDMEAALGYCLEAGDERIEMGQRLAAALGEFWWPRGYLSAGRRWLAKLLAASAAATPARAKALYRAGELAYGQGDYRPAAELLSQSLELYRQQGDTRGVACALRGLGNVYGILEGEQAAAPLRAESLALFRAIGDAWGCAWMLLEIGRDEPDSARQRAMLEESLSMARSGGHPRTIATALGNLGKLDRREARHDAAERHMQEALTIGHELGDTWISAWMLAELGLLASDAGDVRYASALFAESLALFRQDKHEGGITMVTAHIDEMRRRYRQQLAL
jgi:predicted ATPase